MQLPKIYEPQEYESDIYALWEKSGAFIPKHRGSKESYSIVLPPPNANANLHLGHALTIAVEDIAVRFHRMQGKSALFLPGADHAGFETWVVYEKELNKQGKTRFDFTREELYAQVWDFVQQNRDNYQQQFRALGPSFDWSKFTFTLDEKVVERAYATFKQMWEDKLIYRGERLVNYCTFHGTSFSDIEVVYQDDPGHLWHITYPLTDGSDSLTVATTRPETMLGDTAVAVHPDDERYKDFIGKTIKLPLTHREIPILADSMVDKDFGSGAVKITPAHDQNDYDVAGRHDLPFITVIDHEGKMTRNAPVAYRGHDVLSARQLVIDDLQELGFLEKTKDHNHSVGHCYKCGTVIQPLLREQWFIDIKPLATKAIKALRTDQIAFYPNTKRDQAITYLKGIRDWNISRQIAWGIPIPAFQNVDDPDDWIYDDRVGEETIKVETKTYRRDPDVFDTWFSSGQWPFATLDYPNGEDFKEFYPLSLIETGFDIMNPWVCRMIMLGLYVTGKVPFEAVYLHGMVTDTKGQKMSKSKGNVINPMEVLGKFGSDALRIGMIIGQTPGTNQPFVESKVISGRNFCNKLWNVARYVESKVTDFEKVSSKPEPQNPADVWIMHKLQHSSEQVSSLLEQYRFSEAYEVVYHLLWDDFADWYVEASKVEFTESVLAYGLDTILRLVHPFAPFVSEAIWQTLHPNDDSTLATAQWPKVKKVGKGSDVFEDVKDIVSEIRYVTSALKLSNATLYYSDVPFLTEHKELIKKMARIKDVSEVCDGHGLNLTRTKYHCWLDVDLETAQHFLKQLAVQQEQLSSSIKLLEERLSNKDYASKAPKKMIDQTKAQLAETKELLIKVSAEHERFTTASKNL